MNMTGLRLASLHSMAVDYVKTGEPAVMPRELSPRKWPHFMEKKHKTKEQTYTSKKVLGRLYDQVERVDFVPAFSASFDKRILDAYNFDEDLLQSARDLKMDYDAAMHRIMAQHEIRTEFEVWSTFVLHHAGDSKDYKFHEVIGELSNALKFQFREACYQKAGGKEFERIGPLVAAMYQITFEEMAQAVSECNQVKTVGGQEKPVRKMTSANMPLMSFPWLFQGILGKIANGPKNLWPEKREDANMAVQRESKRTAPKKSRVDLVSLEEEGVLETAEGVTHRGEVLELFENLIDYGSDEPSVAPKVKSNSTSSGSTSLEARLSVDEMLFDDSAKDSVAHEMNGPKKEIRSENLSHCLMDAPIEGVLSNTESENSGMPHDYCASSNDSAIKTTSGGSRSKLPDYRWRLVEEFAQFAKKGGQMGVPLQKGLGTDASLDPQLVDYEVSAAAKNDFPLPGDNDLLKEGDHKSGATEGGSRNVLEAASFQEMENDEVGSDYESGEEAIHLDTSTSLLDKLMKLNED